LHRSRNTNIWTEKWFRTLSPTAKLTYMHMYDACDSAGFFEVDVEYIHSHTRSIISDIEDSLDELKSSPANILVVSDNNDHVWITNFLSLQNKTPLTGKNKEHIKIFRIIHVKIELFEFRKDEILQILPAHEKPKRGLPASVKEFRSPTIDKITKFYERINIIDSEFEASAFFNHYHKQNWVLGNNIKMSDWQSSATRWVQKHKKRKSEIYANSIIGTIKDVL